MPKGSRGGSKAGSDGSRGSSGIYKGVFVEGEAGAYQEQADRLVKSFRDVLDDFGAGEELKSITFREGSASYWRDHIDAAMDGAGGLKISKSYLAKNDGTLPKGQMAADTKEGTGAHEAGHAVTHYLLKKYVMPEASMLDQSIARKNNKLEKAIVKEAKKRSGSKAITSKYGATNYGELVAEAISDVYTNKGRAIPFSREVVGVMKDIKKGSFKPKISVTESERRRR